jgi:hypothetical protein
VHELPKAKIANASGLKPDFYKITNQSQRCGSEDPRYNGKN